MNTNRVKDEDHYQCRKIKAERDQLRAELAQERERVRRYREDLARCRHQASYSIGNDDALRAQLGKVREIVNDALSAGEGGE